MYMNKQDLYLIKDVIIFFHHLSIDGSLTFDCFEALQEIEST